MSNHNSNNLKILYWNAQSIREKSVETFDYLCTNNIDIALFQETWLKPNHSLYHHKYKIYRYDRLDRTGGGVAIAINNNIKHNLKPTLNTEIIEYLEIEVETETTPIAIITAYFPGTNLSQNTLNNFKNDLLLLTQNRGSFIICGDLNARHRFWNCSRRNQAGTILLDLMTTGRFNIHHPTEPTHYPTQRRQKPSTIDLILSNQLHNFSDPFITNNCLMSDHKAIEFSLYTSKSSKIPDNFIPNFKQANWDVFRSTFNDKINLKNICVANINSTSQIDLMINTLESALHTSTSAAVPFTKPTHHQIILTDEIKFLITERNRCRRQWQRTRDIIFKSTLNHLNNKIKTEINAIRNKNWSNLLKSMNVGSRKMWKTSKLLKKDIKYAPPLQYENNTYITDHEKVNILSKTFLKSHEITLNYKSTIIDNLVKESVTLINNEPLPNLKNIKFCKTAEIYTILKQLRNNKAPGPDKIQNIILKKIPKKGVVYILHIMNACLALCYFPKAWKKANVLAIPKPGKNITSPDAYRPISLLSSISKILEKIILKRICKHVQQNNIIPSTQFGFRPQHSTNHQLVRAVKYIKNSFDEKFSVGMVLFDNEKAFDTVWHDGLMHKLLKFKFPIYLIKIIKQFVENREFKVCSKTTHSQPQFIPAGVPQGSRLSPTLYNIYIADFPTLRKYCETAFFADDLAIFIKSNDRDVIIIKLQSAIHQIHDYYNDWKIKINPLKSKAMFFTRRRLPQYLPDRSLKFDSTEINWSLNVKYLGVLLDKTLTFAAHTQTTIEKVQKCIKIYYSLINRNSKLSQKNKIILYKVIFQSIILYGSPVWGDCAQAHKQKLQVVQNKILKLIMNLPYDYSTSLLHHVTQVKLINECIQSRVSRFRESCYFSENELISNLF